MSGVSGPTGAPGLNGFITDPPAEPPPGERLLSDPKPLAPGERYLSDPKPLAPGERLLSDPKPLAPGERLLSDPPPPLAAGDRWLGAPPAPPAPGDRWLGESPAPLAPGDRFLSAPATTPTETPPRPDPTASDYLRDAAGNVGNFFEDLWDKNYGEAAQDAGQAILNTGSALHEALFGEEKKKSG